MNKSLRNLLGFGSLIVACGAAISGCADEAAPPLGGGTAGTPPTGTAGAATAGTFGTSGAPGTAGAGTAGTPAATAGTPGVSGTFGSSGEAGTFGATAGATGTAGAGTAGAGGAGTAGAGTAGADPGTAGAGGTPGGDDFPQGCPAPKGTHATDKLTRTCWKGSANECSLGNAAALVNPPSNAFDADLATRFSTGAKMTTSKQFTFDIDMGKAVMINGIATQTTTATDVPPFIEVDVSTDGTTWKPVACGPNSAMADISFDAVSARYVRLISHGLADAWWSMVDFNVFRSGADDTCGAGATDTKCTATGMTDMATCCGVSHKL